jgi:hypothetical protein
MTVAPTLFDLVRESDAGAVAVIGLVKNAGKTTVVNALMEKTPLLFGLTSLGLDGERVDHLTGRAKPRIAPPAGTLVATTEGSLARSCYQMEIVERLPFHTSLGDVVIGVSSGEGCVEVSGPTTLAEVAETARRLRHHGALTVLVDGAINRLGSAAPRVSDAVIMATGGMVADTLDEVVETTVATLDMLQLPRADAETRHVIGSQTVNSPRLVFVDQRGRISTMDVPTVVGEGVTVAREVERRQTATLFVAGALTEEFVDDFTRVLPPRLRLTVVVRDATVLILSPMTVARFGRRHIDLRVLDPLRVLAVTANPYRLPHPYNPTLFFRAVADAVGDRAPVFDVVHDLAAAPAADRDRSATQTRTV